MLRYVIAILSVLWICCEAAGQTTQPAPDPASSVSSTWTTTIKGIAAAASDEDALRAIIGPACSMRRFDGDHKSDAKAFAENWPLQNVLGIHAYEYPPQQMAQDIAADVDASPLIPDRIKSDMALEDPIARNAAATVAVKWVEQTLHPDAGTPIGVILLWDTHNDVDDDHRLGFVLIQGKQESDGSYRIVTIVWGNPLQ
jgi:hypothetical protein